jgi:hypothetical protein
MSVPVGSGHRPGDLGQASEGLTIPGEAVPEDHDPLELAVPLSRKQRAGLESDAVSGLRRPPVEENGGVLVLIGAQHPLDRLVERAKGVGLQAIGEHSHQQPALKMGGRLA